jgi:protein-disulfide isomerase
MHSSHLKRAVLWMALVALWALMAACTAPALPVTPADTGESAVAETAATPAATAEADDSEATSSSGEQVMMDGIPVGFTEEGYPYRGNPDAPITVYEYSDFQCPFCARHVIQTEPALKENYVSSGEVRFVFRDFPLEGLHPNAIPAAIAANCVAEQGILPYWEMHSLIFRTQSEWGNMSDPAPTFARLAEEAGADADLYAACLTETAADKEEAVRASVEEAASFGFTGTPSFLFVNEETTDAYPLIGAQPFDVFESYVTAIQSGEAPTDPAAAQQQADPEIPYWATEEGLAPNPDTPGVNMAGDFWRGNPDAPLTVVEFSDFQCPFCRQHSLDTQPVLDEQFVDTGDVRWVFKHFPVEQSHPQAVAAAGAAQCAGNQGKFWEMHDLLFERMDEWGNSDVDAVLLTLAEELELDIDAYNVCMEEQTTYQKILADLNSGSGFVRGTPTFVVLYGEQGRLIPGALPADQFGEALNQLLAEAKGE